MKAVVTLLMFLVLCLPDTDAITSVVFSPDGTTLASGSEDGTVRLWKITD